MHTLLACLLLLSPHLLAVRVDPDATSFELREKKRVDTFDFAGSFPNLENIDIDARRKKRVEMMLTGDYPALETINYEGTFGSLLSRLTGSFPKLSLINFLCTSAKMQLDLRGNWEQDCDIFIKGTDADVLLKLPENVGLIVTTKTAARGKVVNNTLKKKGWGLLSKTFHNTLEEPPVTLNIHIEIAKGTIILD